MPALYSKQFYKKLLQFNENDKYIVFKQEIVFLIIFSNMICDHELICFWNNSTREVLIWQKNSKDTGMFHTYNWSRTGLPQRSPQMRCHPTSPEEAWNMSSQNCVAWMTDFEGWHNASSRASMFCGEWSCNAPCHEGSTRDPSRNVVLVKSYIFFTHSFTLKQISDSRSFRWSTGSPRRADVVESSKNKDKTFGNCWRKYYMDIIYITIHFILW